MTSDSARWLAVQEPGDEVTFVTGFISRAAQESGADLGFTVGTGDAIAFDAGSDSNVLFVLSSRIERALELLQQIVAKRPKTPIVLLVREPAEAKQINTALEVGALDCLCGKELTPERLAVSLHLAALLGDRELRCQRAEQALSALECRFSTLVENSTDGIALVGVDGALLYVSQWSRTVLGYDPKELIGRNALDFVHPDDIKVVCNLIDEAIQSPGSNVEAVYRFRHKDGGYRLLEGIAVNRMHNPAIGAIVINHRDLSERQRLDEENRRLVRAVEQSAESIIITDAAGTILYVNPAFERVSGYTRLEVIGQNPRLLKSGKQSDELYREMWATLVQGSVWSGHLVNKRKDGTFYEEEATISPVRDTEGRIVNYVAVKHDLARERSLEQQLIQAQKMEAIGQLAGGVAHDFNNMLAIILGYSDVFLERLSSSDPLQKGALEIKKASERAAALTRQLLAFSRRQVLELQVMDLNTTVLHLMKMLGPLIGENIQCIFKPAPKLGNVQADPMQIEQVILNLAVNARDAMHDGGMLILETDNVEVDETLARQHVGLKTGAHIRLSISDTGCGISPEDQVRIFEPFFTTKEKGKGTGLGLSTVYGIVKQSGGYISVHSETGRGTTFQIYLPRVMSEVETEPVQRESAAVVEGSETLLLVEDEDSIREFWVTKLKDFGYKVLEAHDAQVALDVATHHAGPIHLLVTDVVLPGLSGQELAERLSRTRSDMKVLYVSGYTEDAIGAHGILTPGIFLLQKPFTIAVLHHKIREVLGRQ